MRVSFVFHLYMYLHLSLPTIPCVLWSLHIVISCIINWTEPQPWLGKCWLINRLQRISCLRFCVVSHSVGLYLLHLLRCFCYLQPLEIESQFHVIRAKRGNTRLKTSLKWPFSKNDCVWAESLRGRTVCVSTHAHSHRQQAPTWSSTYNKQRDQVYSQCAKPSERAHKTQW